jgi:hypothetical protein
VLAVEMSIIAAACWGVERQHLIDNFQNQRWEEWFSLPESLTIPPAGRRFVGSGPQRQKRVRDTEKWYGDIEDDLKIF